MIAELFLTCALVFGPVSALSGDSAAMLRALVGDKVQGASSCPLKSYSGIALSLPSIIPGMAIHSKPPWDFGQAEIKTIKMLRDWEDGGTASRPHKQVLIYGPHPQWVSQLNYHGIKTIGLWKRNERWPNFIVAKPIKTPFADQQFQVYIFDEMLILSPMLEALHLMFETGRITTDEGFFLYRNTHNGIVATLLRLYKWRLMDIRFHDFDIWQKEGPQPQVDFVLEKAA